MLARLIATWRRICVQVPTAAVDGEPLTAPTRDTSPRTRALSLSTIRSSTYLEYSTRTLPPLPIVNSDSSPLGREGLLPRSLCFRGEEAKGVEVGARQRPASALHHRVDLTRNAHAEPADEKIKATTIDTRRARLYGRPTTKIRQRAKATTARERRLEEKKARWRGVARGHARCR